MEIGMSKAELNRVEVMTLRREGSISQAEAGRRLGLGERQVRRLERQFALQGAHGLRSLKRGVPSNHRTAPDVIVAMIGTIREFYRDFGPTLAAEYLAEHHGVVLSKETVRKSMIEAKLWRPRRGPKARIHALRERRPCFGDLIQVDGSIHDWFEGRAPRCCLLVFIDDATSRLTQLHFVPAECTLGYMEALYGHVIEHGVPRALYSDRHGIFRVNTGAAAAERQSEFGRALTTLGIEGICANSPQAKGRVERANRTLQDRLIKAMRIEGIVGMEAANRWLPGFMELHNERFAVEPAKSGNAHAQLQISSPALQQILARRSRRKLSNNLSFQFRGELLQVSFATGGLGMRGASVEVVEHFDGRMEVLWRTTALQFKRAPRVQKAPVTASRKDVLEKFRSTPKSNPVPIGHPWKRPMSPEIRPKAALQ